MTRKLGWTRWLALALVCMLLPLGLAAEPKREPPSEDEIKTAQESLENATRLHLACALEVFGRENKAPDALITAGRLLLTLRPEKGKFDNTTILVASKDDSGKPGADAQVENYAKRADDLFKEAQNMDVKNNGLKKIIDEARKTKPPPPPPGTKGGVTGPKAISRTLGVNAKDTWTFKFKGELPAYVSVSAAGKMHIEIIRGANEQLANVNLTSASATATPPKEESWTVIVQNSVAGKPTQYTLTTN